MRTNPIIDEFILEWNGLEEVDQFELHISNASGQLIASHKIDAQSGSTVLPLDVSGGIYFYSVIINGQRTSSGKIIKQ